MLGVLLDVLYKAAYYQNAMFASVNLRILIISLTSSTCCSCTSYVSLFDDFKQYTDLSV